MSESEGTAKKHRRQHSWREKFRSGKLAAKLGELTEKVPLPRSSRRLKLRKDAEKSPQQNSGLPPFSKIPFPENSSNVLKELDEGYFTENFDPLVHELQLVPASVGQQELDNVVDKLASALEVVSAQLSTHVLENHDKFVEGINTVASVETDLQLAHVVAVNARINLRFALEEVKTNMRIAKQTKQKQGYMAILEQLSKLQNTQQIKHTLKEAQESGKYAEAIMLCAECFDELEALGNITVALDLKQSVHKLYMDTVVRMDSALQAVCNDFRAEEYKRVLQGFMFQDITHEDLAEKILHSFQESIVGNSTKVVRSLIVTKPNLAENILSTKLNVTFTEMCQGLPFDLLRPCLAKLLEILFDVLCSFHHMAKWHEIGLKQVAAGRMSDQGGPRSDDWHFDGEFMDGEIVDVLGAVHDVLVTSRKVVWDTAARQVRSLLTGPAAFEGEHFLQVMEWCQRFLAAGEAFIEDQSELLRSIITIQCGKFFETYHKTNIEALEQLMRSEQFVNISVDENGMSMKSSNGLGIGDLSNTRLADVLNSSSLFDVSSQEDFDAKDFDSWVDKGNPFRPDGSPRKKRRKDKVGFTLGFGGATFLGEDEASQRLEVDELGINKGDGVWTMRSTTQSTESFPSTSVSKKDEGEGDDDEESPELFGEQIDEETQMVRMGPSSSDPGQTSGCEGVIVTNSARQILKWIKNYGALIRPLNTRSKDIFNGTCELFDTYLLEVFLFVGGISLEEVVWDEDLITTRLRSTLLRILGEEGSRYKDQVNRIQSSKPVVKQAPGPSKENKFTKEFKNLFGKDRASTPPPPHANGSGSGTPRPADVKVTPQGLGGEERAGLMSSTNLYGLRETVVAVGSVETIASELTQAKSILQTLLPPLESKNIDSYYSRTVDAVEDLKDCALRNASRRALHEVLDAERGIAVDIASTVYDNEDPSVSHNHWVDVLGDKIGSFAGLLEEAQLPSEMVTQMWDHAMKTAAEAMVEGLSRVEKCTMSGRSSMSLDLSHIEKHFKVWVPPSVSVNLRIADTYIKAFYEPWEELPRWAQTHHAEYGERKVLALVEVIAQRVKEVEGREFKRSEIRTMKNDIGTTIKQLLP